MTKNKIELPIIEPLYSTYHYQGCGSAFLINNPSILNWYLNEILILTCTKKFLSGFTTPELTIDNSSWKSNPYLVKKWHEIRFIKGHIHYVIKNLLEAGYYVYFSGVDDYYVDGKSWFHERHFSHDGCICGYDPENDMYCIYAYDKNWVYQKFWTPKKSFEKGRKAIYKTGAYGYVCGIKPQKDIVIFSPNVALNKISEYLNSTLEKYPETSEGTVCGIVVHDYIAKYLEMLYNGSIPYEKLDRRIFRVIWEHKKAMLKRILLIEQELVLDDSTSKSYETVVREADTCRMLYASHRIKRRDSVLPIIQKKLLTLKSLEQDLLEKLLTKAKGEETP